ncbi:MAG TPA: MBL fold metallo-hydrolase, partial [Bacillota bacterium]|nr:MBL fold metallo-hydrolase [Bacillota bacterium]
MEAVKVLDELYMFSSYLQPIDLTFNQYQLLGEEPLLVHAGNHSAVVGLAPKIKELLKGRPLRHIFISHFESDECGGLKLLMEQFPEACPVCSAVTARQLSGFGITEQTVIKAPGQSLSLGKYQLQFISYPSEAHLWEGLLAVETARGVLFSSDLFIRRGGLKESVIKANWAEEVKKIAMEQIPNPTALEKLQ